MPRGYFISIEGIDGCGKTTLLESLAGKLSLEYDLLRVREPGGTEISEQIRAILLDVRNQGILPRTEALLYASARAQLVEEVVKPALERGCIVLADRYMDSTVAYQGYGRELNLDFLRTLNRICTNGVEPDLTLLLDIDPELAGQRRLCGSGAADRLEAEGLSFQARVREGYLRLLEEASERIHRIDAGQAETEVLEQSWKLVGDLVGIQGKDDDES